jgi:hypothetical protein
MRNTQFQYLAAMAAVALLGWGGPAVDDAAAQKIICWKDKSGKTIGCGDKVPPEYQDSATRELDKRGVTRKTTENAEEIAKREAQEKAQASQKAEEAKRLAEQRRQDAALINTFSNEKEIDLKRDRDLQVVDTQLTTLRVSHKSAAARQAEAKSRMADAAKSKDGKSDAAKDDMARADADMKKLEQDIAAKEKEKEDVRKKYSDMRERYIALRGGPAPTAAAAPAKK